MDTWIRQQIKRDGPVTVARFMEWALYHPEHGYYSRGPKIGPRGDFTTSPEASPAFGRLLARHVADIDRLLGEPAPFNLVEAGPGLGTLAAQLLSTLRDEHVGLYERLRYRLVEISPGLARAQQEALAQFADVTAWVSRFDELPVSFEGAVVANEVVDAFPVHVLEHREGRIVEQYVEAAPGGEFRITYAPPSRADLTDFLDRYGIELAAGERIEVNLAAETWIAELAGALGRGVVTIIDYGGEQPERYSASRREGTLLSYYGGAVTDNILARPGEQDMTALVDFTALRDAAMQAGLTLAGITRQANFLLGLGLGTEIRFDSGGTDLSTTLDFRRGLQTLISPEGLGRFHVLLLSKGLDRDTAREGLSGLKYEAV